MIGWIEIEEGIIFWNCWLIQLLFLL